MCDGLLCLLGWLLLSREDLNREEQLTYCHWFMSSVMEEEGRRRKWGWVDVEEGRSAEASNI